MLRSTPGEPLVKKAAPREDLSGALDLLETPVAIVDRSGTIIHANASWLADDHRAGLRGPDLGAGGNYINACRALSHESGDQPATLAQAVHDIVHGRRRRFAMDYQD